VDYDDRGIAAMPKLVGAPSYARPPVAAAFRAERPVDPDDLPLVSERTSEDHDLAVELGLEPTPSAAATIPSLPPVAGTAVEANPHKRGIRGLFHGRNGRSGAG
jgi:hypothetical protein